MKFSFGKSIDRSKAFVMNRSQLESRWDPNYYRYMSLFRERIKQTTYPLERLKRSLELLQYGISERATAEPVGVPMLRMINLQDDTWDISDLKYIQMTDAEKKPYLLKHGDLLFNRTNSKELVGKCNVFNLSSEYVFASYLIRVRLRQGTLLPDYVNAFLASALGRLQIDAISRQIAGMTNINAEEIRELQIPMLDDDAQGKVVTAWKSAIARRDKTLEDAHAIVSSIDDVMLKELDIHTDFPVRNNIKGRIFRRTLSEVSGGRLDPIANQDRRRILEQAIYSSRYPISPLRKVVNFTKTIVNEIVDGENYVGLENIKGDTGEFVSTAIKETVGTAIRFLPGQILFPKLRPYLNKTHLATFTGICSTEFHVLTTRGVSSEYLNDFLRSRAMVGITSLLTTGNTLPRLQMSDIEKLPIPIPPTSVQKRLKEKLHKLKSEVREIRHKAHAEMEKAKGEIEALILNKATGI